MKSWRARSAIGVNSERSIGRRRDARFVPSTTLLVKHHRGLWQQVSPKKLTLLKDPCQFSWPELELRGGSATIPTGKRLLWGNRRNLAPHSGIRWGLKAGEPAPSPLTHESTIVSLSCSPGYMFLNPKAFYKDLLFILSYARPDSSEITGFTHWMFRKA
jgi:hypothetical protein